MKHNIRALQVLESVYRNGSFIKAAGELGVTPSAVSHQLASLHARVGEQLFEKVGRELVFTKRGQQIAESVKFALSEIDATITGQTNAGLQTLRVTMCSCLGIGWFIPRVNVALNEIWLPNIHLQMHTGNNVSTELAADVLFTTAPLSKNYWSYKIFEETLVAVAAPGFTEGPLITHELDEGNYASDWRRYMSIPGHGVAVAEQETFIGSSHYVFGLEMAVRGVGAVLVPDFLAEHAIINGSVRKLAPLRIPTGRAYYLNVKHIRRREPQIDALCRWVRNNAAIALA